MADASPFARTAIAPASVPRPIRSDEEDPVVDDHQADPDPDDQPQRSMPRGVLARQVCSAGGAPLGVLIARAATMRTRDRVVVRLVVGVVLVPILVVVDEPHRLVLLVCRKRRA